MLTYSLQWLGLALDATFKSLLLALVAAILLRVLRVRDSQVRHRVWTGVLAGMLMLPLLSQIVPQLRLPQIIPPEWLAIVQSPDIDAPDATSTTQARPPVPVEVPAPEPVVPAAQLSPQRNLELADSLFGPVRQSDSSPASAAANSRPDLETVAASQPEPLSESPSASPSTGATSSRLQKLTAAWPFVLAGLWLTGSSFMLGRLFLGFVAAWRLTRASTPILEDDLSDLGLDPECWPSKSRSARLLECPMIRVPLTLGLFRPAVMLPLEWLEWSTDKLHAVLLHERTHVERGDTAISLLAEVNIAVNWFNPLSWWLRRHLSALAEEACDDAAIVRTGDRTTYARHLLEVAAALSGTRGRVLPASVSMARRSNVETRIDSILDFTRPLSERPTWATTLVILGLAMPVIGLAAAVRPAGPRPADETAQNGVEANTSPTQNGTEPDAAKANNSSAVDGTKKSSDSAMAKPGALSAGDANGAEKATGGPVRIFGRVVDPEGKAVGGATVTIHRTNYPKLYAQPLPTELLATLTTDSEGKFEYLVEPQKQAEQQFHYGGNHSRGWINVAATKSGFGMAFSGHVDQVDPKALELKLRIDESVRGLVIDTEGRAISGAVIQVVSLESAESEPLDRWLEQVRRSAGRVAVSMGGESVPDTPRFPSNATGQRSPDELPRATTDAKGQFEIAGMGRDRLVVLQITKPGIALANVHVITRSIEPLRAQTWHRTLHRHVYYGSKFDYVADPSAPVEGMVKDKDSGEPIANAIVATDSIAGSRMSCDGLIVTTTDAKGRYRIEGLPVRKGSELKVLPQGMPYLEASDLAVPVSVNMQPVSLDISLKKGVWATGRVTDSRTGKPVKGMLFYSPFKTNPSTRDYPQLVDGTTSIAINDVSNVTDDDGRFRLVVIPGRGLVAFKAIEDSYCSGIGASEIPEFADGKDKYDITCDHIPVRWVHVVREIAPREGEAEVVVDLQADPGDQATLRFVDASGKQLDGVQIHGCRPIGSSWETLTGPIATLYSLKPNETRHIQIKHEANGLVGLMDYRFKPEQPEQEVTLTAPAVITGRLLDPDGQPLVEKEILAEMRNTWLDQCATTAEGSFQLKVPAGEPISVVMRGEHYHPIRAKLEVSAGERIELGDLEVDLEKRNSSAKAKGEEKRTPMPSTAKAQEEKADQTTPAQAAAAEESKPADPVFHYAGTVVDESGQPVAGAAVRFLNWRAGSGEVALEVIATTQADGKFELSRRKSEFGNAHEPDAWRYAAFFAMRSGYGLGVGQSMSFETTGRAAALLTDEQRRWLQSEKWPATNKLTLPKDLPVRGRILNTEGRPVAGATLAVINASEGASGALDEWEAAAKEKDANFYTVQPKLRWLFGGDVVSDLTDRTVPPVTTDADGRFTMTGLGQDRLARVFVIGPGIEAGEFYIRARPGETIKLSHNDHGESNKWIKNYYPAEFTHVAGPSQPVTGIVKDLKTGQPLAGLLVRAERTTTNDLGGNSSYIRTTTDAQGKFTLNGFPLGAGNEFVVLPPKGSRYLPAGVSLKTTLSSEPLVKDVALTEGVLVRGKAIDARTGQPVAGYVEYFAFTDNPALEQTKNFRIVDQRLRHMTGADGQFEIPALPGPGIVTFWATETESYLRGAGRESIKGKRADIGGASYDFSTAPYYVIADNYTSLTQIEPAPDAKTIDIALSVTPTQSFQTRVVAADGRAPTECFLYGERAPASWYRSPGSSFTVRGYLPDYGRRLMAFEPSTDLIGRLDVTGEPPKDAVITLGPATRFIGRLVDESGAPLPETRIEGGWRSARDPDAAMMNDRHWRGGFDLERGEFVPMKGRSVITDENGRFELRGIMPGLKYSAQAMGTKKFGNESYLTSLGVVLDDVVAKPGPVNDLGDVVLKPEKPAEATEEKKAEPKNDKAKAAETTSPGK